MFDIIHIKTVEDANIVRNQIRNYIFPNGYPTNIPTPYTPVGTYVFNLTNQDYTRFIYEELIHPYLIIPKTSNNKLAIVCCGHTGTYESFGTGDLVRKLNSLGYTILISVMPGGTSIQSGNTTSHANLPLNRFLEHYILGINYAVSTTQFTDIICVGLSGGGWTTHLLSAIDTRITRSFPIAGALSLDNPVPNRDWEQNLPGITPYYYKDLMVLAKNQVQILHTNDECCFNLAQYNIHPYENEVKTVSNNIGNSFQIKWINQIQHYVSKEDIDFIVSQLESTGNIMPTTTSIVTVVDDKSDGFVLNAQRVLPNPNSQPGKWNEWNAGYGGTMLSVDSSVQGLYAEYNFPTPGNHDIYITWVEHANRCDRVPIKFYDGNILIGEHLLNQKKAPVADRVDGDKKFDIIGNWTTSGNLTVRIYSPPSEYAIADAVLVVTTPLPTTPFPTIPYIDWELIEGDISDAIDDCVTQLKIEVESIFGKLEELKRSC